MIGKKIQLKIPTKYNLVIDTSLLVFVIIFIRISEELNNSVSIVGLLIIGFSILLPLKTRKNQNLLFLTMIIGFINISISIVDLINNGEILPRWQLPLRQTSFNLITATTILLFLAIVNLFMNGKVLQKKNREKYR